MTRCHFRIINKLPVVIFRAEVGIIPPVVSVLVCPPKSEELIALSLLGEGLSHLK